jgi:hypothetical protein
LDKNSPLGLVFIADRCKTTHLKPVLSEKLPHLPNRYDQQVVFDRGTIENRCAITPKLIPRKIR